MSRLSLCPRILFIVDAPNWAHDYKTINLMRALGKDRELQKRYQSEVTADDLNQADLIVVYYWLQLEARPDLRAAFERNRHKLLVGICSHWELADGRRERGLATLRGLACGVFVNNLSLYREYQSLLDVPVFYTPNGVDTTFYSPASDQEQNSRLRIGWAGSLTNVGPDERGYYDLIVPAVTSVEGVELVVAAREEKWRGPEEMREFYRSLDAYLCASRREGTPNPCLEAAACGVPLLTTRVGNMPELIRNGVNGLFIDREIADIATKAGWLRDHPAYRTSLAQHLLRDIQAWDWSIQSQAYQGMFEAMLRQKASFISRVLRPTAALEKGATQRSINLSEPERTGVEWVEAALMRQAQENLLQLPEEFFNHHQDLAVTIVMLSYGRLDQTLNAVQALKDHVIIPFKLLLIDNHSDLETQGRLKALSSQSDFMELFLLDDNLGCAGGRMYGLNQVETEYVMFLDNDIEVFPGTVEHLLHSLESNPAIIAAAGNVILPDGARQLCGGDYWSEDGVLYYELLGEGRQFDDPLIGGSGMCRWVNGGLTMFRKQSLSKYPYDVTMRSYYEDLEWCYRLNQMGAGCFYRSAEAVALHYHEPKSLATSLSAEEGRQQSMKYLEAQARFYQIHGRIIQNLFDFIPELGPSTDHLSIAAGRILLALINAYGGAWVLDRWNHNELAPLFAPHSGSIQLAEKEQTIKRLSAQIEMITSSRAWKLVQLLWRVPH